jgi:hypothetical protein
MPVRYDALPYGSKALSFVHPNEVALPLHDSARFVIVGEPSKAAEIVYTPKPLLHDPEAGPPFVLTDELYVYEAALLARDRHPADTFLSTLDVFDSRALAALEHWIGRRKPPARKVLGELRAPPVECGRERDRRICWEFACDLSSAIEKSRITPIAVERDSRGRIIPLACRILLADALAIALRRGDAGEIFSSLLSWYQPPSPELSVEEVAPIAVAATAANSPELTRSGRAPDDGARTERIRRLADWIFGHRTEERREKSLLEEARRDPQQCAFTDRDFFRAYGLVYRTERHRPPKTGWPLQQQYADRDQAEQSPNRSPKSSKSSKSSKS